MNWSIGKTKMQVKDLLELCKSIPPTFQDAEVFIDDKLIDSTLLDIEHGELNLRSTDERVSS